MEDARGKLSEWIKNPRTSRMIKTNFIRFLREFADEAGNLIYLPKITEMCSENRQSLVIDYTHLSNADPRLALWIADEPLYILPVLNEVAYLLV
jgi:DNA replication licensing factor MCM2